MENQIQPYVGPRPFELKDKDLFFGRDHEVNELLSLTIAHQVTLIYAQSGAGKTSLLNAKVMPRLMEEGYEVLSPARVQGVENKRASNIYVYNALTTWSGGKLDPKQLAQSSLAHFLKNRPHAVNKVTSQDEWELPRFLFFDQFEELFTFYAHRWQERKGFFEQVCEALEEDHLLRVVFVMREDYIAELDPYVSILPGKLRTRFRVKRLDEKAALQAITKPLVGTPRRFADDAAELLVKNLLKVPVKSTDGNSEVMGQFVEPVQLQVVCQSLWEALGPEETVITKEHVESFGDVNLALLDFYEKAVASAIQIPGVKEGGLRRWFEDTLITPDGTRGIVFRARDTQKVAGLPVAAVDLLKDRQFIREKWRGQARWYELAHDRLIEPIQKSNKQWEAQWLGSKQIREQLEAKAVKWSLNRGNEGLLGEAELLEAERWLVSEEAAELTYSDKLRDLVQASRVAVDAAVSQHDLAQARALAEAERQRAEEQQRRAEAERLRAEEQEQRAIAERLRAAEQQQRAEEQAFASKRFRRLAAALALMFLFAGGGWVFALNKSQLAAKKTELAEQKEREAKTALAEVKRQRDRADEETARAEEQAEIAEKQKRDAEDAKQLAQASAIKAEAAMKEALMAKEAEAAARRKEKIQSDKLASLTMAEADLRINREQATRFRSDALAFYYSGDRRAAIIRFQAALDKYKELNDESAQADTLIDIGGVHSRIAETNDAEDRKEDYRKAEQHYKKSLDILERTQDQTRLARALHYLGIVYDSQQRHREAEAHYLRALEVRKALLASAIEKIKGSAPEPDQASLISQQKADPELASSYTNLADLYAQQGKFNEAEKYYEEMSRIREELKKPDDLTLGRGYLQMAALYRHLAQYGKARPYLDKAKTILEKVPDSRNKQQYLAFYFNESGLLNYYQAQYAEASRQYEEARDLNRKLREPESPEVATNLHNLALTNLEQGHYAKAEELEEEAIEIRGKIPKSDPEGLAISLLVKARLYREQGKHAEAEPLYQQALSEMIKAQKGEENHRVATILHYQAEFYAGSSKNSQTESLEKAESLEKKAIAIYEKVFSPDHLDHWYIARSRTHLAVIYTAQQRYVEAESQFNQAFKDLEKALGKDHPEVADNLSGLALLYFKQHLPERAEPFYKRALEIREKALGPAHPQVAESLINYAVLLKETNRPAEASAMRERAHTIRAQHTQDEMEARAKALLR